MLEVKLLASAHRRTGLAWVSLGYVSREVTTCIKLNKEEFAVSSSSIVQVNQMREKQVVLVKGVFIHSHLYANCCSLNTYL